MIVNAPQHVPSLAQLDAERFAGAINTLTLEGMMRDGKALQLGTSHELGQNFAKAFDTRYLGPDGARQLVWQTSWGASTRMVGGLIMSHGDDQGLRVPPRLAPVQAVVLAVKGDEAVLTAVNMGRDADTTAAVAGALAGATQGESAIPTDWAAAIGPARGSCLPSMAGHHVLDVAELLVPGEDRKWVRGGLTPTEAPSAREGAAR